MQINSDGINDEGILKWIYKIFWKYIDNSPTYLIKETMENSEEELSYDEAREKVPFFKV